MMRTLKLTAYLFAIVIIAQACGGSKKAVQVIPEVEWAKSRPNIPSYYVGIGQANKVGAPNDYMQTAKQNALADMASDISINISSNSVISAFETQNLFFEDYSQTVKAETQKELQDYELVDTWEDEKQYWVYYRLSKVQYKKTLDEKKTTAALKSVDFYSKALQSIDEGDLRTGLVMLVKALEPIRFYFSETISVMFNGKEIFLGNEIIQKFSETVNSILVNGVQVVDVKVGKGLSQDQLLYTVATSSGVPLKGIQLKATYSEKPILKNTAVSDIDGIVSYSIDAVRSSKIQEQLTVMVLLDNIIKEGTSEIMLKKMLSKVATPSYSTTINVIMPPVFVEKSESKTDELLLQACSRKLSSMGIPVVDKETKSDYNLSVTSNIKQPVKNANYQMVQLSVAVVLKNSSGAEVFRKSVDVKGSHFEKNQAIDAAYQEAVKKIENSIIREVVEGVIKGKKAY